MYIRKRQRVSDWGEGRRGEERGGKVRGDGGGRREVIKCGVMGIVYSFVRKNV